MRNTMILNVVLIATFAGIPVTRVAGESGKNLSLQRVDNPPMQTIYRLPPEPAPDPDGFEVRPGFRVIASLDEFRKAIRQDNEKVRMKPGVYRAAKVAPPIPEKNQEHIISSTARAITSTCAVWSSRRRYPSRAS